MSDIAFENVSFSYDQVPVLKGVSFEVERGEYIGLIGPNGGGKTTAIKLMLGLLKPENGSVLLLNTEPQKGTDSSGICSTSQCIR